MFGAPEMPEWFWGTAEMRAALVTRHMGKVVRAFRTHPYHGRPISQAVAAGWLFLTQSQLSRIEGSPTVQNMDRLIQIAHILRIPPELLWFSLPEEEAPEGDSDIFAAPVPHEDDEWERMSEILRRTFLKRGLAAVTLPAIGLDELRHVAAALTDARRYADEELVRHFESQLADCAANDRTRGPRQSIPIALGLVAAIEEIAKEAKPEIRRALLRVGAKVAEFIGWLHRDIAMPELAGYWRDRAVEWAQASGDLPMQGYVLLKKSQAAWDERDALRMLILAEATQEGPWQLPLRVRAEAAQQEARGHAMLSKDISLVEPKIDRARELLAEDAENFDLATHYDAALFGLQVAICYTEVGQPTRALDIYERWLSPQAFSRRDYGYFLSLKSGTFLADHSPNDAATTGLQALTLARETNSARTHQEVLRLVGQLQPWSKLESVRELRHAMLA
ncbi:XRE family transcriptional regulator [Actinomadura hibisca]|uniref:XRE family transcriptional regulator n=1 Tax=Actinomadura hibisca TaxID=68565 RepID=UPI0012FA216B|nr:XRE family transcriptional regulator [Actinomadura hibisca]